MNKVLEWILFAFLTISFSSFSHASNFRQLNQSVVRIVSLSPTGIKIGTGFVINETQDVVTHYQVIAESLKLLIADGGVNKAYFKQALVKWSSKDKNVAILHVPNLRRKALPLSSVEPNKGMPIYTLGFPVIEPFVGESLDSLRGIEKVLELSVTKGLVSGLMYTTWENKTTLFRMIQHSAEINKGNHGGPLINACGQVVGVNTAGTISSITPKSPVDLATDVFYASHISYLIEILKAQQIPFEEIKNACLLEDNGTSAVYRWIVIIAIVLAIIAVIIVMVIRYHQWVPFRPAFKFETFENETQRLQHLQKHSSYRTMNTKLTHEGDFVLSGFNRDGRIISLVINDIQLRKSKQGLTIGRSNSLCELVLSDDTVSRRHARLSYKEDSLYIEDMNSLNGSKVDGMILEPFKPAKLNLGQTLRLGDLTLSLRRA
jgi:hypothetical protein